MAVYGRTGWNRKACEHSISYRELIWEQPEVKEMTVAEIEKILGYPVKIVKE